MNQTMVLRPEQSALSAPVSAALCMTLIVWLLSACSNLPEIRSTVPGLQLSLREPCQRAFPAGPRQFVHSIEALLPDDSKAMTLGILTLDPDRGTIHCVIMTIEGFILFDARFRQTVTVNRAIYPFDSPDFAKSMMADIRLIFFPPGGPFVSEGVFSNGSAGCRWLNSEGLAVDVVLNQQRGWIIRQYDISGHLSGQVRISELNADGIPGKIEFSRHAFPSYILKMTLLQAERLPEEDERLK